MPEVPETPAPGEHPNTDRDELHDIYRSWRAIADSYEGTRVLVGEIWLPDVERFARYLRPDELHTAFNFDFLARPWNAAELHESIETTLSAHAPVGAPSTWVLSNHDVTRPVTRYGREDTTFAFASKRAGTPTNLALGLRRSRAAALITAALPGSLYIYQGDELGLPEVEDIPAELLQDPMHFRSLGIDPGRDGCRVPLPWSGTVPPFGYSPDNASTSPWLPQPIGWRELTAEAQQSDPTSMLRLYQSALRIRAEEPDLGDGRFAWLSGAPDVLTFTRGDTFLLVANLSPHPVDLPDHQRVLLTSETLVSGMLPSDSTAWLQVLPSATENSDRPHHSV